VLVDDDLIPAYEDVPVMEMERPPVAAFMVEQLVLVFRPLVRALGRRSPDLPNIEDRPWRMSTVGKEAAELECESPGRRLLEGEALVRPDIESNAVAF
jgi:hypothetical protein